ncbi:DUF4236 domain-containing protein (plasmid) [Curtobacterium sp. TC1]|nr:DUF4236 domain-containing protein [Curtobacterium sp. TC1]
MGISIRTSVKAGPLRFNLSKSGIGVSAGVPGLRIGAGPRGNYVRVGSSGVMYLSSKPARSRPSVQTPPVASVPWNPAEVLMDDTSGLSALELRPTGGDDIVQQLNDAARRPRWGWIAAIAAFGIGAVLMPWGLIVWALAIPGCWWLFLRDGLRKNVVLFYDLEDNAARWFDRFVTSWDATSSSAKLWRTVQSGQVQTTYQHKVNAGVGSIVQRVSAEARIQQPRYLATNIDIPTVRAGSETLYFLPDRLLVGTGKRYSDVAYRHLTVRRSVTRFVEQPGHVPKDTQLIGETWQYVNVKGGPDRRFKNNPALPVVQYGRLEISTAQGLFWSVQSSRVTALDEAGSLLGMAPR